jgi:hypothetical protein
VSAALPIYVGQPGVRDLNEQDNCADFEQGDPTRQCDSDGHYMCARCKWVDPEQFDLLKLDTPQINNWEVVRVELAEVEAP